MNHIELTDAANVTAMLGTHELQLLLAHAPWFANETVPASQSWPEYCNVFFNVVHDIATQSWPDGAVRLEASFPESDLRLGIDSDSDSIRVMVSIYPKTGEQSPRDLILVEMIWTFVDDQEFPRANLKTRVGTHRTDSSSI